MIFHRWQSSGFIVLILWVNSTATQPCMKRIKTPLKNWIPKKQVKKLKDDFLIKIKYITNHLLKIAEEKY